MNDNEITRCDDTESLTKTVPMPGELLTCFWEYDSDIVSLCLYGNHVPGRISALSAETMMGGNCVRFSVLSFFIGSTHFSDDFGRKRDSRALKSRG